MAGRCCITCAVGVCSVRGVPVGCCVTYVVEIYVTTRVPSEMGTTRAVENPPAESNSGLDEIGGLAAKNGIS